MDSINEQFTPEVNNAQEQPLENNAPESNESKTLENQTYDINGEQVGIEELKSGYMRQSDYTRKTQELAEQRKALETSRSEENISDEVLAARDFLKQEGVVTKQDLENERALMADEMNLQKIFDQNPDLKAFESAIRQIGQNDDSAYEDIIVKYGFSTKDKLAKAKANNTSVKGSLNRDEPKGKSIKDMSIDEYKKWKQDNNVGKGERFTTSFI